MPLFSLETKESLVILADFELESETLTYFKDLWYVGNLIQSGYFRGRYCRETDALNFEEGDEIWVAGFPLQ
jgi:hypothetical protein